MLWRKSSSTKSKRFGRHNVSAQEELETYRRGWDALSRPLEESEIRDQLYQVAWAWDIKPESQSGQPCKIFTRRLMISENLVEQVQWLNEHFAAINNAEWPVIRAEQQPEESVIRLYFELSGPVTGIDIHAVSRAEEHLEDQNCLPWQHGFQTIRLTTSLPD